GYQVALFGQSMGGSTVIAAGAGIPEIVAIVAWVPDPNVESYSPPKSGLSEEGGQVVRARYWQEAHDMQVAKQLTEVKAPMYIVQCSDDEYVSPENHRAIEENAQPQHTVEMFKGHTHSAWTYKQATTIIRKS